MKMSNVVMFVWALSLVNCVVSLNEWRLPNDIQPVAYNIRLLPFIEEGNFTTDGLTEMTVECLQSTFNITFHSVNISIDYQSIQITNMGTNQSVNVMNTFEDPLHQTITLTTSSPLIQGIKYKIAMKFISILGDQLIGFYRASYVENGVRKWYAVTDFEAPDARRAFPCFDEPQLKATFQITLGHKDSMTAISNMPLKETIPMDGVAGYVWDIFETSPKMSTYLVAFMVSEFTYRQSDASLSNVQFRIWSRPGTVNLLEYSSTVGPLINEFFEEYFGVDYALPKQDMVAVTERNSGAMENWGLVTYREYNLFFDERTSSVTSKRGISEVIAHELAHQWTGNFVTLSWWSELWLNEGFARYLQFLGSDAVEPSFRGNETILVRTVHSLLITDSVPTRPIYVDVNTPAELTGMFNTITYDKGACVVRMMSNFLGEDTFRRGMNLYFTRNAFGNAASIDLFQAMNDQAIVDNVALPTDVKTILETWTLKMGYPLINVTRQYATGGATVTQNRLLRIPLDNATDPTVYRWWVPLTYKRRNSQSNLIWMSYEDASINIQDLGALSDQWVIFNVDQVGFYRVMYDATNYQLISDQLITDHTELSTNSRAQLLDDAFNLAILNAIAYSDALSLTNYLSNERDYTPWEAVLPELDYIHSMFLYNEAFDDWKNYMSRLVGPYLNYVGFSEPPRDGLLNILARSNAISWACKLAVPECVQNAQVQYSAWMDSPADVEVISRHQKSVILCAGIENGNESDWQYAYQRFLNPLDASESGIVLNAMACSQTAHIQQRMLDMLLNSTSGIAGANAINLFNSLANNPAANSKTFQFLSDKWSDLQQLYGTSMESFYRTVSTRYNTPVQLEQMLNLRDQHLDILGNSSIAEQAIATVEANVKWMDRNSLEITNWLKEQH